MGWFPKDSVGVMPTALYGGIPPIGVDGPLPMAIGFEWFPLNPFTKFSCPESILSMPEGSMEGFRVRVEPLREAFCTRKLELEALESAGDVVTVSDSSLSLLILESALSDGSQPHFCFRGIAAVTAPHEHGFDEG